MTRRAAICGSCVFDELRPRAPCVSFRREQRVALDLAQVGRHRVELREAAVGVFRFDRLAQVDVAVFDDLAARFDDLAVTVPPRASDASSRSSPVALLVRTRAPGDVCLGRLCRFRTGGFLGRAARAAFAGAAVAGAAFFLAIVSFFAVLGRGKGPVV